MPNVFTSSAYERHTAHSRITRASYNGLFMIGRGGLVKEATMEEVPATQRIKEVLGLPDPTALTERRMPIGFVQAYYRGEIAQ